MIRADSYLATRSDVPDTSAASFARTHSALIAAAVAHAVGDGREIWVRGLGGSMWPTIRDGDRVLLSDIEGTPRRGDVVLVARRKDNTLHRVVEVTGRHVVTSADASGVADPPAPHESVIARGVAVERGRSRRLVALRPTLRFGILPLVRHALLEARRALVRRARARRAAGVAPSRT